MSRHRPRFTQAEVTRAMLGGRKAGVAVTIKIALDGTMTILSAPADGDADNDLDRELAEFEARNG